MRRKKAEKQAEIRGEKQAEKQAENRGKIDEIKGVKKEIFSESSKEKKRIRRKNKIFSDVRKARKMKKIEKVKKQIEGSILNPQTKF